MDCLGEKDSSILNDLDNLQNLVNFLRNFCNLVVQFFIVTPWEKKNTGDWGRLKIDKSHD